LQAYLTLLLIGITFFIHNLLLTPVENVLSGFKSDTDGFVALLCKFVNVDEFLGGGPIHFDDKVSGSLNFRAPRELQKLRSTTKAA
jgi:hypothetical protein